MNFGYLGYMRGLLYGFLELNPRKLDLGSIIPIITGFFGRGGRFVLCFDFAILCSMGIDCKLSPINANNITIHIIYI